MKKTLLTLSTMVGFALANNLTPLTTAQMKNLENQIPMFKNRNITISKGYDRKDLNLYQLETKFNTPRGVARIPALVDKNTKVVFVGTAYTKDGKKLTMPIDKSIVDKAIAFTYGTGEKGELYLFTDPECPFCQKLEREKGSELEKYKVHVVLFPLSFHKHAKPMVDWILKGKTDKERYDRFKKVQSGDKTWAKDLGINLNKYNEDYKEFLSELNNNKAGKFFKKEDLKSFKDYLEKSNAAFYEVGARGTPTIKDKDFKDINPSSL